MYTIKMVGEDKYAGRVTIGAPLSPTFHSYRYTFTPEEKGLAATIASNIARAYGPCELVWENDKKHGCQWLVQVPSNNPEPDFPEDCYVEVPCGEELLEGGRYPMCEDHHSAMTMDARQFEDEVESGRTWS